MSDKSNIEWTDATWNPIVGCTKVSPGCDHCYAERLVNGRMRHRYPDGFAKVVLHPERLDQPLRWKRPRRIFVNSLSDLFEAQVPDEFIVQVFDVMATASRHIFQVLTKRPGRMASFVRRYLTGAFATDAAAGLLAFTVERPPPNIWLGTSVEDQHWADVRVPKLLDTPAAVRFLSCEPLLGPVDLDAELLGHPWARANAHSHAYPRHILGPVEDPDGLWRGHMECIDDATSDDPYDGRGCGFDTTQRGGIDWVIVGGESGPGARPMHPGWARVLRDQCQATGVAYLFKQWGEWGPCDDLLDDQARVLTDEGRWVKPGTPPPPGLCLEQPSAWAPMRRCGKQFVGRELDGRTWDEFPSLAGAAT